eukprot:CAMPEP_0119053876 /NCGR_PEP_ID=MMETSP1177-20130426/74704_1 /TAXON_ID=2985 /ORGANISM="Ochromonas sp, Strain CCMP1899" /LENGTH=366 /DNA_ID=CAMNT_0007033945 /DNA_START=438 /DNA_END=1535 /DNA_ORIENTATION=+
MPPVTAIIGPEAFLGNIVSKIGARYNVPVMLSASVVINPYSRVNPSYNTTYTLLPAPVYMYRELVNAYIDLKVKTIVAVAMVEPFNAYNTLSCFGTAELAASRGIQVLAELSITPQSSTADILKLVENIRDDYKPDAIIWCDWASCSLKDNVKKYNSIPAFKEANYLPKTLAYLDCADGPNVKDLKDQGLFDFVSYPNYVSFKMKEVDVTEGDTPFSNVFRPSTKVITAIDQLNYGSIDGNPSSAELFFSWYRNTTGFEATYQTVFTWSSFDVLESAIYRTALIQHNIDNGVLNSKAINDNLYLSQMPTPAGRVIFNPYGVNTNAQGLFLQSLPSSNTAEIVYPIQTRTASVVYPMPSWDERIYTW